MNKKIVYILYVVIFIILLILSAVLLNGEDDKKLLRINQQENEKEEYPKPVINANNEISNGELLNIDEQEKNKEENQVAVVDVNDETFEKDVLKSEQPVLVDFYASWCPPCKRLSPIVEEIARERNNIKVVKVNIDVAKKIAQQYEINAIPILVYIKNGQEVKRITGLVGKEVIENMITDELGF